METMAYKTDEKARGKRTISKLRAKVDPSHPNYMGEAWLSTPDGQTAESLPTILGGQPRKKHRGGKAGDSKATRQHQSHW